MIILSGKNLKQTSPLAATIGFFDGVHIGHQHLIKQVISSAKEQNILSAVITFRDHPRKVINTGYTPELLTTFDERVKLIEETGIDICIILDFNLELAALTAQEFIEQILSQNLSVKTLIVGYDHRFGKNRSETYDDYVRFGQNVNMNASKAEAFKLDEIYISSSSVRRLLAEGNVSSATKYLKRNYSISGHVIEGSRIGRQIGYPTANLKLNDEEKVLPMSGVYAVRVKWNNNTYGGMLNIGVRPTVCKKNEISIEVNLFDFNDNLYNENIEISFIEKLRDERKMNGLDDLKHQLSLDKAQSVKILKQE